jgi:hypothetical protein
MPKSMSLLRTVRETGSVSAKTSVSSWILQYRIDSVHSACLKSKRYRFRFKTPRSMNRHGMIRQVGAGSRWRAADGVDDDLDETTSRLLDTLPRSQAISAVMGFLPIKSVARSCLLHWLTLQRERLDVLFGERRASGLPVTKEDIDRVFEQLKNENARA